MTGCGGVEPVKVVVLNHDVATAPSHSNQAVSGLELATAGGAYVRVLDRDVI